MLDLLVDYGRKHLSTAPEPGFSPKDVRWAIDCDEAGNFLDVIELGDTSQKRNRGQRFLKCPDLSQGEMKAEGVTKSHFLADTAAVVTLMGVAADDKKSAAKHEYFKYLLKQASSAMPELGLLANELFRPDVLDKIRNRLGVQKARAQDKVTLRFGDAYPVDSGRWHDWWRSFRETVAPAKDRSAVASSMRCFASGDLVKPARTHTKKVEGLADVGGRPQGDVLIGFKQDSFCSYGLEQSLNAAVSDDMVAAYSAALNELIRKTGYRLAGTKIIHWFKGKDVSKEEDPLWWLEEGIDQTELNAQQRARELLTAIQSGKRVDLGDNYYYALTLSGARGRVMVRDWMEGRFGTLVENVDAWFADLEIVNFSGDKLADTPKLERVVTCLLPSQKSSQDYEAWIRPIGSDRAGLWNAAVRQTPIPYSALARASLENTKFLVSGIFEEVTSRQGHPQFAETIWRLHARMALMRAYHRRNGKIEKGGKLVADEIRPYLNENHPHPAYHCGRIMAVLARLQREALGDVGAGVVQRYYAAASSTPALVLGRLVRTSQAHLNKLPDGLSYWYENLIAGIWGKIKDSVPTTLTLEEQTLFALGYYQQMAQRIPSRDKENQTKEVGND
jgi:CRISPR-associated protein Csd1